MVEKILGLAIASLVLGIVGFFISWIPLVGWVCPILAIVFGFVSLNKLKKNTELKGKGMAITGIILGFIGLVVPVLQIIGAFSYFQILKPSTFIPGR